MIDFTECLANFYKYHTNREYKKGKITEEVPKREATVLYIWNNEDSWLLKKPKDIPLDFPNDWDFSISSFIGINNVIIDKEQKHYLFIKDMKKSFVNPPKGYKGRLLNKDDKSAFDIFHAACPNEDKEEGQVSLDDDMVYGIFCDESIVSVASFWYWGDYIADIGVLTHPGYRRKGLVTVAVTNIVTNTNRDVIWRASIDNLGSNNTAKRCGFKKYGKLYTFKKKCEEKIV